MINIWGIEEFWPKHQPLLHSWRMKITLPGAITTSVKRHDSWVEHALVCKLNMADHVAIPSSVYKSIILGFLRSYSGSWVYRRATYTMEDEGAGSRKGTPEPLLKIKEEPKDDIKVRLMCILRVCMFVLSLLPPFNRCQTGLKKSEDRVSPKMETSR